ncbi:MAG: VTC domain-containing protein [Pelagibacteraceae bacterium TMED232]|nr:MAG: VTC domain-containing protein [Pelagibacteraceae bacterium TMED232]|tara:strand:+ start:10194 stop:10844 length:651 start_codon:yes stop_codon:yes gene_type:complete
MNNERIEKKFVLGKYEEDFVQKILLGSGFKRLFAPRKVSSIYLDTINYNFVKDNINGVSKRKKIRFRWYNDDYTNIYLEEKNKQNFLVKKKFRKILKFDKSLTFIENLRSYFLSLKKFNKNYNFKFILKTSYLRTYWISNDKKIRATIDSNIIASPINDLNRNLNLNETILEFKFSPISEKNFRNLFHNYNLNLRSKKYSKYLQSFLLLDDAGLIN